MHVRQRKQTAKRLEKGRENRNIINNTRKTYFGALVCCPGLLILRIMSSVDSDVELRRFTSINSSQANNSSWQNGAPTDQPSVGPTPGTSVIYDSVPGDKHQNQPPPPLPDSRKTTSNTMYATRGETLHPNTTLNMSTNPPDYTSDGLEAEIDMSSKCLRVTCLSILVMVSLFLAIVAVVLVLLLWFGVYTPNTNCTVSSGTSGEAVTGGISTSTPTPTPCVCPSPDLSPIRSQIEQEASNLTELIKDLNNDITQLEMMNNETDQSLLAESSFISSTVSDINSTCYEALANLTSQNVSLAGLEFEAELRNVGVYSSCIYEYLSNCSIGTDDDNCTTSYHDVIVDGYYNLDVACHVEVKPVGVPQGLIFAPLTNLRTAPRQGETISSGDSAADILSKSQMRCECALVALYTGAQRSNTVTCSVFRSRCPIVSNFQNVMIITP